MGEAFITRRGKIDNTDFFLEPTSFTDHIICYQGETQSPVKFNFSGKIRVYLQQTSALGYAPTSQHTVSVSVYKNGTVVKSFSKTILPNTINQSTYQDVDISEGDILTATWRCSSFSAMSLSFRAYIKNNNIVETQ